MHNGHTFSSHINVTEQTTFGLDMGFSGTKFHLDIRYGSYDQAKPVFNGPYF